MEERAEGYKEERVFEKLKGLFLTLSEDYEGISATVEKIKDDSEYMDLAE